MAQPMGFYAKHGLNVEVIKTAGWAVIRDKTHQQGIRRRPHAVADAARDHARRRLATRSPTRCRRSRTSTARPSRSRSSTRTSAIRSHWKGFKFAVPFDYSMHNYLLRYYLAEHGIDPDQDVQIRAVPPPEMVANLRADNIDGFLGPDPMNQRAVYRRRRLHPHAVEGHLGRPSVLRLRGVEGVRHRLAEHLRGAAEGDHRRHRLRHQGRRTASRSPRRSRRRTTSTSR